MKKWLHSSVNCGSVVLLNNKCQASHKSWIETKPKNYGFLTSCPFWLFWSFLHLFICVFLVVTDCFQKLSFLFGFSGLNKFCSLHENMRSSIDCWRGSVSIRQETCLLSLPPMPGNATPGPGRHRQKTTKASPIKNIFQCHLPS